MSSSKQLNIGLFGFGVVGEGLYQILKKTPTLNASIKRIVIKHPEKKRNAPKEVFTQLADEVLNDDSINVVVELIDDADAAYYIVTNALKKGKAVVSANKKLIAEHLEELLQLQKQYQVPFLYEASACASIPVIRNLEEYYDNDLLHSISGIVNGSTNYILTKMYNDGLSFTEALLQAQQLGFAESNPSLDILGIDAVNKLTILLLHAYGTITKPTNILQNGIQNINQQDASFALQNNYTIKLVAYAGKLSNGQVATFLLPQFIKQNHQFYKVENEYNAVVIESSFADQQFFYGKGAGSFPTASAVLSDISALRYNYQYEYRKKYHQQPSTITYNFYLRVYVGYQQEKDIPKDVFEQIEEYYNSSTKNYLIGVINAEKILKNDWWKQYGISLVVMPNAIAEEPIKIKQTESLQLVEN